MSLLQEMGFRRDSPAEVILTSYTPDGKPHGAAVGIYALGDEKIKMNIFADTQSYENLSETGSGVVNVVSDPDFFVKGGLTDLNDRIPTSFEFEDAEFVNAPYLENANAAIEFEVEEMKEKEINDDIGVSKFFEVVGAVRNVEIIKSIPRSPRRADFYLIESAIIATKAIEADKKGNRSKFEDLMEEILFFKNRCEKISSEDEKCLLIQEIVDYLEEECNE